jgi:hypothetical protein
MKVLMENWRAYLSEAQASDVYGSLYLFEGDEVSKTSFYDAINMLSESDDDADRFLENWERSIDHMFGGLDEAIPVGIGVQDVDDAILKASTQAYMALNKMKGKAFGSVMNVVKKMSAFAEKNPKTAKAAGLIGQALITAAAATVMLNALEGNSWDADGLQQTFERVMDVAKQVSADVADTTIDALQGLEGNAPRNQAATQMIAPPGWERWADGEWLSPEFLKQQQAGLEKINDTISQAVGDPGLEQAMSGWEDGMEQQWQGDVGFFADAGVEQATPTGGIDWQSMNHGIDADVYDKYGPYGDHLLNWEDGQEKTQALEKAAKQWDEFKKIADTLDGGGSLEDLGMETRNDFRKWANDTVHAPGRLDQVASNIGRAVKNVDAAVSGKSTLGTEFLDAGQGSVPPNYMKWLRKMMRASLKN